MSVALGTKALMAVRQDAADMVARLDDPEGYVAAEEELRERPADWVFSALDLLATLDREYERRRATIEALTVRRRETGGAWGEGGGGGEQVRGITLGITCPSCGRDGYWKWSGACSQPISFYCRGRDAECEGVTLEVGITAIYVIIAIGGAAMSGEEDRGKTCLEVCQELEAE